MKTITNNETSVTLYNPETHEIIGIFKTTALAARYLFGSSDAKSFQKICQAVKRKGKTKSPRFDHRVAVRNATVQQREELTKAEYVIHNNYPIPEEKKMRGYVGTRLQLKKDQEGLF